MAVFFSATDMEELNDNSICHNFYLSFIVNNAMDFQAKIATRGTFSDSTTHNYVSFDENGKAFIIEDNKIERKTDKLFIYDCDIKLPYEDIVIDNYFLNNVEDIIEKAKIVSLRQPYNNFYSDNIYENPTINKNSVIKFKKDEEIESRLQDEDSVIIIDDFLRNVVENLDYNQDFIFDNTDEIMFIEDFLTHCDKKILKYKVEIRWKHFNFQRDYVENFDIFDKENFNYVKEKVLELLFNFQKLSRDESKFINQLIHYIKNGNPRTT